MEREIKMANKFPAVNKEEIKAVQVLTPRLQKLKKQWEDAEPQVYVDDTLLFTESWKETEGLPVDIRWAKAFEKRLDECPILLRDGELLAGSLTKFIRGNGTLCAMKPHEILKMVESGKFDRKTSDTASTKITPEDLEALRQDALYWIDHMPKVSTVNASVALEMGEEAFDLLFDRGMIFEGRGVRYTMDRGLFQNYSAYGGGVAQVSDKCIKVEQGNAKMLGMQHATGRYILFVDSDEARESRYTIENTVKAFQENPRCHVAVCSGYKKPKKYPYLSGYISECGDPFSFFVYNFPKDYRFYGDVLRKYYKIRKEDNKSFVFECDLERHFPLIEGGCGGIMMDGKYFDEYFPECRNDIAMLYHSFYLMCHKGDREVLYMKNTPLLHYSSDHLKGYLNKLKWRICNNIHFTEKGKEVFSGRQDYQKKGKYKKYLFVPYALSIAVPLIHSIPYAITRKNPVYLLHCVLAFYCVVQIAYNYGLKILHITPDFVAYGSKNKIGKR